MRRAIASGVRLQRKLVKVAGARGGSEPGLAKRGEGERRGVKREGERR